MLLWNWVAEEHFITVIWDFPYLTFMSYKWVLNILHDTHYSTSFIKLNII